MATHNYEIYLRFGHITIAHPCGQQCYIKTHLRSRDRDKREAPRTQNPYVFIIVCQPIWDGRHRAGESLKAYQLRPGDCLLMSIATSVWKFRLTVQFGPASATSEKVPNKPDQTLMGAKVVRSCYRYQALTSCRHQR